MDFDVCTFEALLYTRTSMNGQTFKTLPKKTYPAFEIRWGGGGCSLASRCAFLLRILSCLRVPLEIRERPTQTRLSVGRPD
eukprot:4269980-Amphidinium_carterae.1